MYYKTKQQATTAARTAQKQMKEPKKWRISVNKNIHWYWCLEHKPSNAHLTLWPVSPGKFHAMLSLTMPRAGDVRWSNNDYYRHPQRAVNYVIILAAEALQKENTLFQKIISVR